MTHSMTRHASKRCRQRGISNKILDLVLGHGAETDRGIYLGRREADRLISELKQAIRLVDRARNAFLVVDGGEVITAYRAETRRSRGRRMGAEI